MKASQTHKRNPLFLWLGFVSLAGLFSLDFYFDVRARDLFSWMDPYQYFEFAVGVLNGSEAFNQFEIPSIFPFFLMPLLALAPNLSTALWINAASMLLLLLGVHRLCRELAIRTPSPWVGLLVLSSPLLIGLSRSLYVEFTLAALMAMVFALWLRFLRRMDLASGLGFGLAFAIAFMTKLTLPVFMILPVAGATLASLLDRDVTRAARLVYTASVPIALAIALQVNLFAPSLGYYLTVASTSLPFMYLMGPSASFSLSSATYYLQQIGETFLFLLTPLLALGLWSAWPRIRATRLRHLGSPRAAIWLWLLSPVLILALHPLKEPRHAAASVVPAVLLVVLGIEALSKPWARRTAMATAVVLACVQYAAVTLEWIQVPYFMDRSLHYRELREAMVAADPRGLYQQTPLALRTLHWKFNQNVALVGFPPNEALALTWQAFPSVVFDLETFDTPGAQYEQVPYDRFEDLFFLAGINSYNRRCGWHTYQQSLSRKTVVEQAELLIVNIEPGKARGSDDGDPEKILKRFPNHERFAVIDRGDSKIYLLRATHATTPYRTLYARNYLARHKTLDAKETRVIARELLLVAVLDGNVRAAQAVGREFRSITARVESPVRNIYWIGGYPRLIQFAAARSRHVSGPAAKPN